MFHRYIIKGEIQKIPKPYKIERERELCKKVGAMHTDHFIECQGPTQKMIHKRLLGIFILT